jgi:acetyltransferase-like isoleucine patch superfamily enzyme
VILDCGLVTIGNRVQFGPFVSIFAATHETEVQSRRDGIEYARPVVIGDDCWIGGNTTIMPGVTIGSMYSLFFHLPSWRRSCLHTLLILVRVDPQLSL